MTGESSNPNPKDIALQICEEIRKVMSRRLFTQCGGCVKASKGNPQKLCFYRPLDSRGCGLVNRGFDTPQALQ